MNNALAIIEQVFVQELFDRLAPVSNRKKVEKTLIHLSVFLLILGVSGLLLAFYLWLATRYESITVAAGMGGIFTLLALVAAGAVCLWEYLHRSHWRQIRSVPRQGIVDLIRFIDEQFGETIVAHPKSAFMTAVLSGYVFKEKFM